MFTGIIQCTGRIARSESRGGDLRLTISAPALDFSDVAVGESILHVTDGFGQFVRLIDGLLACFLHRRLPRGFG